MLISITIGLFLRYTDPVSTHSNILIDKLETFIRKYYKNLLLKGGIILVSLLAIAFFVLASMEYVGRFSPEVRTVLFSVYVLLAVAALVLYIIRPLLGLLNVNRRFGYNEASRLVGQHFPEVKDKLLNTLQLQEEALHLQHSDLLVASIEQRTQELSPIPFAHAISLKSNIKYVKLGLLPALALVLILLVIPGFKQSGARVVQFNKHFEIEAPFQFISNLAAEQQVIQNRDVPIELKLEGNTVPEEAYIYVDAQRYKMRSAALGEFYFTLKNVQQSKEVHFESGGFSSNRHQLNVAPRPSLLGYTAFIDYPNYLGREDERISNLNRIQLPAGSVVEWDFKTKNTERIVLNHGETIAPQDGRFSFTKRYIRSDNVQILSQNQQVAAGDSIVLNIEVIPDRFPAIQAQRVEDSAFRKRIHFIGNITDDHGFSRLAFHYKYTASTAEDKVGTEGVIDLPLSRNITQQKFYHYWDLESIGFVLEDELEYYFTVWDNDGVSGAKSTKTSTNVLKAPNAKELKEESNRLSEAVQSGLSEAQSEAKDIEQDVKEIERLLTEKKSLSWNDKQKIQQLIDKQKDLQQRIQNSIDQNKQRNQKDQEFNPINDALKEKQEKLEELFEEVLDPETKELMEKIQELLNENNKEELQQALDQFQLNEKELSKEMDRMLELFKELELEKKLDDAIIKTNKLAQEQKDLEEKTKKGEASKNELSNEQEELNQKMDDLKNDLKDIQKKNEELAAPLNLQDKDSESKSIEQSMQDAKENVDKNRKKSAAEDMEDAAKKLKDLATQLQKEKDDAYEEQQEEDLNNLRQILENLIQLSHDQEGVIDGFKENMRYSPRYVDLRQKQRKIKDETRLVEDSLLALSKRNETISHFINKEVGEVNHRLNKSLAALGERQTSNALIHQQYAMTGYNNLALMLSEALQEMQEQMKEQQSQQENKGQCKKPGSGKGGKNQKANAKTIKKMQDELAKQLKQMKQGQSNGKSPQSKEFAKMAAQQEAIRQKMQELERNLKKEGRGGSLGNLKRTQDLMDEVERDLYYKRLDNAVFQKLQQLEIKLSEHDKAEREQDIDNKRTSEQGQQHKRSVPPSIEEYLKEREKETELLKQVSPELNKYYRQRVKEYFAE